MRDPWDITREMFLSEDEVDRLLNQVREAAVPGSDSSLTDRVIIECLLFSGLRTSEFCRLQVGETVCGTDESAFLVRGTRKPDRTVFVPESVSALVRDFVENVRPRALPEDVAPDDFEQALIFNERGRPYERTGLYRRVVRILKAAGLGERASVQLLRHTYGYLAYKRTGGNLLFVQRQLGHAHPMVTSVYAQFVDEPYAEISDRIADRLSKH